MEPGQYDQLIHEYTKLIDELPMNFTTYYYLKKIEEGINTAINKL